LQLYDNRIPHVELSGFAEILRLDFNVSHAIFLVLNSEDLE
jgi:hypothetical protein